MVDSLYYGSGACPCCSGATNASQGVSFAPEVLEEFLRKIYDGFDVSSEVEPSAWREVLRWMHTASVEGLVASGHTTHEEGFLEAIRHSNEVFSAFKVHDMGVRMARLLRDEEGKLRSFADWKKRIQPIAKHHVGTWLKTEYDTAILRAHQASDWQEFLRNRDVMPNLRWMPTTSPSPEEVHQGFWASGLTLPVDDPFWATNHPANRWNCKCSLEATDAPVSDGNLPAEEKKKSTAQRGLENNPKDGRLFSDKHPYFPEDCSSCPFGRKQKGGVKNWLKEAFSGRRKKNRKECHTCASLNRKLIEAKLNEEFPQELWEHTYISESGGYVVTEKERIKETLSEKTGKPDKNELSVFLKEQEMARDLADLGHKIRHLAEKIRPINQRYDITFDNIATELKSTKSANNIYKYGKKAFEKQGAEMVIFRFESRDPGVQAALSGLRAKYPDKRIQYYYMDEKTLREYP